jgi:uncharacterized MAPEG superfamily protein
MNTSVPALLLYSVVGAVFLVYLPFLAVGYARFQLGYDKSAPRAMFDRLPDYAKRATWAHENSFEALIIYGAAALMAYSTGVDSPVAGYAAIAFVIARALYSVFYIADIPIARSLMYATASTCSFTLFGLSLLAVQ